MNFKFRFFLWGSVAGMWAVSGWAGEHVRVLEPRRWRISPKSAFQAQTDLPRVKSVEVSLLPWVSNAPATPRVETLDVEGDLIQGSLDLHPGLNWLRLQTPGGGLTEDWLLLSTEEASEQKDKNWGTASPVVITAPTAPRTNTPKLILEGVVTDLALKQVLVAVFTREHFRDMKGGGGVSPAPLVVSRVWVKNQRFSVDLPLAPGQNIVMIRPDTAEALSAAHVAVTSYIYEETSTQIKLDPLRYQNAQVWVSGTTTRTGPLQLTLSALTLDNHKLKPYTLTQTVTPSSGNFVVNFDVPPAVLSAFSDIPLITVIQGKDRASRVWWPLRAP